MKKKIDIKFDDFKILNYLNFLGDLKYIKDIPNVIKSKKVSLLKKIFILTFFLITLVYIILPMDIVSSKAPGFGLIEDLVLGVATLMFIGSIIGNELKKDKYKELNQSRNGKSNVIKFEYKAPPRNDGPNNKIN